ncbi:MAG: hypothetical protein K8I04_15380, partial [Gammaproteobacteria bacterium]|nr:hypothetical protein [Gammaproteobacteria bacterium]
VVAKTAPVLEALRLQFRERLVEKEYRCIVYGEPRFHSDWIERAIATDPKHPDRMTVVDEGGRESATYYEVEQRFVGFAHVRCQPKTGRTHQIRVHMAHLRHPMLGDPVYGGRPRPPTGLSAAARTAVLAFPRQALHATRLALRHPGSGAVLEWHSPLPDDMAELIHLLESDLDAAE